MLSLAYSWFYLLPTNVPTSDGTCFHLHYGLILPPVGLCTLSATCHRAVTHGRGLRSRLRLTSTANMQRFCTLPHTLLCLLHSAGRQCIYTALMNWNHSTHTLSLLSIPIPVPGAFHHPPPSTCCLATSLAVWPRFICAYNGYVTGTACQVYGS